MRAVVSARRAAGGDRAELLGGEGGVAGEQEGPRDDDLVACGQGGIEDEAVVGDVEGVVHRGFLEDAVHADGDGAGAVGFGQDAGGREGGGGAVAFVAGGLVGDGGELLGSDADGLDGGLEIGDVLGEVGVVGGADELDGCGEVGDVGGGVGVGRGGEVGGFVEDAVPCGGRGEDGDGLGRAEGGHPLFVGLAGLGFGLGGFAVGDDGGGAFVAGYNGVLQLDLEGGGAEGGGAGAPLDFEEGGEAGGVGKERGLDRLGEQIKQLCAGGREG
jgi:hypothetical protein